MRSWIVVASPLSLLLLLGLSVMPTSGRQTGQPQKAAALEKTARPFFAENCVACHDAQTKAGALDLHSLRRADSVTRSRETWESVLRKIQTGEMPPKGSPRPNPAQSKALCLRIEREFEQADKTAARDPGSVTAHRQTMPGIEKPTGIPVTFADYITLMYDLQVVAFQTELTRVSTLMIGREGSMRTYPEINISDSHHPLTHHRNNPEFIEKVAQINTFHTTLFGKFLGKLKSTPDGDGSLLDHSMVVYGSGISDGNRHLHENLPVIVAGRGDGQLKPGRHLAYENNTPVANLYTTLLDRAGVRPDSFGDSTGKLVQLTQV